MPVDPFNAAGIGLGAASLAIQLFDGCIKGYTFLVEIVQMPDRCASRRLRLILEFNRLLAWGKVAGLIEVSAQARSSQGIGLSRMDVLAVLSEIRTILDAFADLNAEYHELKPQTDNATSRLSSMSIEDEISTLKPLYEKNKKKRRYPFGTNHFIEVIEGLRCAAKNPKRISWMLIDEKQFDILLGRLGTLNDTLREFVGDYQLGQLQEVTREIHMQMVQVRGSVTELKQLMTAAILLPHDRGSGRSATDQTDPDDRLLLHNLAKLKEIVASNMHVDFASNLTLSTHNMTYARNLETRTTATFELAEGSKRQVWVEWKLCRKEITRNPKGQLDMTIHPAALQRSKQLASLLACPKSDDFCVPNCLGYIIEDNPTDEEHPMIESRLGWVFEMPETGEAYTPLSLYWLITHVARPPLTDRVCLAHKLATSLMYLHSVNWLHKAIRSDNIVFYKQGSQPDLEHPILSGFEYARHDTHDTSERPESDPAQDIYRWPSIQGEEPTTVRSRKIFDIYSLGLVLVEIAQWKPLAEILEIQDVAAVTLPQSRGIREDLLRESKCLAEILNIAGRRYHGVVNRCLEGYLNNETGHSGMGITANDDESNIHVSIALQTHYINRVVQELGNIRL